MFRMRHNMRAVGAVSPKHDSALGGMALTAKLGVVREATSLNESGETARMLGARSEADCAQRFGACNRGGFNFKAL